MPPRSTLKPKEGRPISAVYIGKGDASHSASKEASHSPQFSTSTSPSLPELPEIPSPSSSIGSVKSGLPSPPGTNSTGSGSTGDPATVAIRERPISLHSNSSTSTSSGSHSTFRRDAPGSRSNSRLADYKMDSSSADGDFNDDYDKHDNDGNLDGDDTARLDRKLLSAHSVDVLNSKTSGENRVALQRAKSLAQRNRLVIDKLSRLGSPSPVRSGTPNSRSPNPSQAGSSRSQSIRTVRTITQASQRHETIRSGSETERESTYQTNSTNSNSSHSTSSHPLSIPSGYRSTSRYSNSKRSITPPPRSSERSDVNPNTSPYNRLRHISAPESPHKARVIAASTSSDSNLSKSPSHRKRNRVSMASVHLTDFDEEADAADASGTNVATGTARERKDRMLSEADIIAQSALAAVATSRRSPVGHRRRSALPREFRSDFVDDSPTFGAKKSAGRHDAERGSPEEERKEKTKMGFEPVQPFTPFRSPLNGVGRSSTVRERRPPGSPRWSSNDYRTPATLRTRPFNASYSNEDGNPRRERLQNLRGGSVESVVWSPTGRSLVSEGLRAAGLTRRNEEETKGKWVRRESLGANGDVFTERVRKIDWSPQDIIDDGTRRALVDRERERSVPQRASTSMAQYQYLDRDSPDATQYHRTPYTVVSHERGSSTGERATSALSRHTPGNTPRLASVHIQERMNSASPFGTRRYGATPQTEHARIMLDSLALFETSLAKIPRSAPSSIGVGSLPSHADVLQNAQGMVVAADRLFNLLKQGSTRAIESQVDAEVESAADDPQIKEIVDLWGKVAADYREGSRMADDLIRGITGVLLGIGRVMREFMVERGVSEFGSPSMHGRHASLGDNDLRGTSPDVSHLNNSGGRSENSSDRQSVSSRGSRDPPRDRERDRAETLRRPPGGSAVRPESVLARASPATFQRLKNREYLDVELVTNGRTGGSVRRSTLREPRTSPQDSSTLRGPSLVPADSQETIHPSPTPASKPKSSPTIGRARALPPISIPRPLPTLPSETLLRRTTDDSSGNELSTTVRDRERRRATIRGNERPVFASLTNPASPTIALTPHTVSNAERSSNPLQRADSTKSGRSQVTFSRPTAEKSLSELQQADGFRKRTLSTSSAQDRGSLNVVSPRQNTERKAVSGSETERDVTRRTLGKTRPRMSLDIQHEDRTSSGIDSRNSTSHAADRSAATTILTSAVKRDRRRTVTDIWQR